MAVPATRTAAVGERIKAANENASVRDPLDWLMGARPYCFVYQATAQSVPNNVDTLITFDTEIDDNDTMHSTGVNTGRVVFTTAGLYEVRASLMWASNATGVRQIMIRQGAAGSAVGGTALDYHFAGAVNGLGTRNEILYTERFTAGQYVEMFGKQTSGVALSCYATSLGGGQTSFVSIRARWIGI